MFRVEQILKEEGRRKSWLAAKMGVSPSYLSLLLGEKRPWKPELQRLMAEALGRSEEELFRRVRGIECPQCEGRLVVAGEPVEGRESIVLCPLCQGRGEVPALRARKWRKKHGG